MLGFGKKRSVSFEVAARQPVLQGKSLLADHETGLMSIRALVGVPEHHWRCLYESVFLAFAETVQRLPASVHADGEAGGLLRYALEVADLALKIRRGCVLPPDNAPEVVIAEQDVWTYAVATGALLREAGTALAAQRVLLQGRGGVPIGQWGPWLGPMTATAATHYRIEPAKGCDDQSYRAITPLLVCHVVPRDGLVWLGQHPNALAAWFDAISMHASGHSVITDIIAQAQDIVRCRHQPDGPKQLPMPGVEAWSEQDVAPLIAASTATSKADVRIEESWGDDSEATQKVSSGKDGGVDPGAAFTAWLIEGIQGGDLALNTPKARVHVVNEGLLLVSPAVFREYAGDDWREVQKRFLKQKLIEKTAEGENFFHYLIDTDRATKTIKGVLIRNAEAKLSVTLPAANRLLSRKIETH